MGEKDEARNVKLNQLLLLRFLRSVKPYLKEKAIIPQLAHEDSLDGMEEEEVNSDPESLDEDEEISAQPTEIATGSVLITLFTSKPYSLWSLP